MVLIYYKDKETSKVLSFVEAAFSTVEKAKEFLNTNNIITEGFEPEKISLYCPNCGKTMINFLELMEKGKLKE